MTRAIIACAFVVPLVLGCDQTNYSYDAVTDYGTDHGSDFHPDSPPPDGTDGGSDVITGSGVVGDPCTEASQCGGVPGAAKVCLTSVSGYAEFTGGYCSAECTSAIDCGTGNVCVDFMGYAYYCLKHCSSDGDCRTSEGYGCDTIDTSAGLFCLPGMGGTDY